MIYQIRDWDNYFENDRSRSREKCSFVCVPNKQHGMGFSYVMREKDGASIYGIFMLIIGACSQQKVRNGWLTCDGEQAGSPWGVDDLSVKFRRPEEEIRRAMEILTSEKVGWIIVHNSIKSNKLPLTHREVTSDSPPTAPEGNGREVEENRRERVLGAVEKMTLRIGTIFSRRPTTYWSKKEMDSLKAILTTHEDDIKLIEEYYGSKEIPSDKDIRRKDIQTLLNNLPSEIDRARAWKTSRNGHVVARDPDIWPVIPKFTFDRQPTRADFQDQKSADTYIPLYQQWRAKRASEKEKTQ